MRNLVLAVFIFFTGSAFSQAFDKSITVGLSPLSSYRIISGEDNFSIFNNDIAIRNTFEEPILSYGVFGSFDFKLSKRFSLSTELKYQRLGFKTDVRLDSFKARQPNDPSIPTHIEYTDIFHVGSLNLNTMYSFIKKENISIYVYGGFGIDYLIDYYVKRKTAQTFLDPNYKFNPESINVSVNFGLGTSYKISNKSAIRANLGYNINIRDFNTDPIRVRLVSIALSLGYAFKL